MAIITRTEWQDFDDNEIIEAASEVFGVTITARYDDGDEHYGYYLDDCDDGAETIDDLFDDDEQTALLKYLADNFN